MLLLVPHPIFRHIFRTLDRGFLPLLAQIYPRLRCSGYAGFTCDTITIFDTGVRFGGFGTDGQAVQESRAVLPSGTHLLGMKLPQNPL